MEFSTNTVSRGDYEPITVPITLVQQDLSHCKPQLSYWRSPVTQFRVSRGDYDPITVLITLAHGFSRIRNYKLSKKMNRSIS